MIFWVLCQGGAACSNEHTRASQTEAPDDEQVQSYVNLESVLATPPATVWHTEMYDVELYCPL